MHGSTNVKLNMYGRPAKNRQRRGFVCGCVKSVTVATEFYVTQKMVRWRNSANTFIGDCAKFTKAGTVITSAATINCPRFIPHNEV